MPRSKFAKMLKRYGVPGIILIVVLACLPLVTRDRSLPEGLLQVNGRLEGDRITVSTQYAGRILSLAAAEGDQVTRGQIMAQLDDDQLRMQHAQAKAGLDAIQKQVAAAEASLAVQKQEVPLALEQSAAGVAQAMAERDKANAAKDKALRDVKRARELYQKDVVSKVHLEQADLAYTSISEEAAQAHASVASARTELASARLGGQRLQAQQSQVEALRAERDRAAAAVQELACVLDKHVIKAPAAGTVTTKLVSMGETMAAGSSLFDMVDLDHLYVKAYVPEPLIGKIKLGSEAQVFTDSDPQRPVRATVSYIASRAEFTPKEVQTQDERVKQVFAVKLYLRENPEHALAPGMPVNAVIRWKKDVAWQTPLN